METGVIAEASGCCPSPAFGQLMIAAYVIGGAFVYLWLFSIIIRWARTRYGRHGAATESKLE